MGRKVVFLHEVREGQANQSYGLAVAQLAGVSNAVVKRAQSLLTQFETRALGTQPQLDLFSMAPLATPIARGDPLRERLNSLDVEALSPRDAHGL